MKSVNHSILEEKIVELIEKTGADSTALDVLADYINESISYWDALHTLGQMKYVITDVQSILMEELHPHIKDREENSYCIKELLKQMK